MQPEDKTPPPANLMLGGATASVPTAAAKQAEFKLVLLCREYITDWFVFVYGRVAMRDQCWGKLL